MDEKYLLSVCGRQYVSDSEDQIDLQTGAAYVLKGSTRYISYKEYDPQDPEKHYRTTVKVDENNVVTVMKGGEISHNLILEEGKRHRCEYRTPFGYMSLGIYTEKVHVALDDNGGMVSVRYNIDVENELVSTNELTLNIEEANKNVNSKPDCTEA